MKYLKLLIILFTFIFLTGCTKKVEIYSLSSNAFIEKNESISISTNTFTYPVFTQTLIYELQNQISKNGFTIQNDNYVYSIDIDTKQYFHKIKKRYESFYEYYTHCSFNGYCVVFPRMFYVPCYNISMVTNITVNATNSQINKSTSFDIENNEYINTCNQHNYHITHSFYNMDKFLLDNLSNDNIKTIAKKIISSLFPEKKLIKKSLHARIETQNASTQQQYLFEKSYKFFEKNDYKNALIILEDLKQTFEENIPIEIYYNTGILYEYINKLDLALENYKNLPDTFQDKDDYIERIVIKKKYE